MWRATEFLTMVTRLWWKVARLLSHPSLPHSIIYGKIIIPIVVKSTFYSRQYAIRPQSFFKDLAFYYPVIWFAYLYHQLECFLIFQVDPLRMNIVFGCYFCFLNWAVKLSHSFFPMSWWNCIVGISITSWRIFRDLKWTIFISPFS